MNIMSHIMKLQARPFDQIKCGTKTIEVRLFDEKRRKIRIGDIIEFRREPEQEESVRVEVTDLYQYKTFAELVAAFPLSDFGAENRDELLGMIYRFYSREQEGEFGVMGIRVRLTEKN